MRFVLTPVGYSLADNEKLPENSYDCEVVCQSIEEAYLESIEHNITEWALLDACSLEYYGLISFS